MNYIRESTVAIASSTRWKLARIIQAQPQGGLATPETVDGLADNIIKQWITANHPALHEIWKQRETMDDAAIKAVQERKP